MKTRHRTSLNGLWQFRMDPDGREELSDMQVIFNSAAHIRVYETVAEGSFSTGNGESDFHISHQVEQIRDWTPSADEQMEACDGEQEEEVVLVSVPAPWQSQSPQLCYTSGVGWYQRSLEISSEWMDGVPNANRIILGIDASDYHTVVWVNGIKIGENEGGYLPFEFDISPAVKVGENVLTIRVDDSAELFSEVPHGKQGWYGQLSGIWQPVWLERRSAQHLCRLKIDPDSHSGQVNVCVDLNKPASAGLRLQLVIYSPSGEEAYTRLVYVDAGKSSIDLDLKVADHTNWSPAGPNLYRLEAHLEDDQGVLDTLSKSFGFRSIEARDGRLYLNGEVFYLRGALDQDYYLDTICTTPPDELLEEQFQKAKELGLNLLRVHIKVPDPRYYEIADRVGMLIWTELPNWSVFSQSSGQRGREMLEGILDRDGHHPSILIWTIINEAWGTDIVNEESQRKWLKETYQWLKALDPSRLVVDNSPCFPNFHMQSDIDDYHFYRGIPDQRREWDELVRQFASRPAFTYGPPAEITRTGKEPLILSEFGNWGLPDADLLVDSDGADPWWFETGGEWTGGVVHPLGVRERFRRLGLRSVFGSWKAFVDATQDQQFNAMKYELESIRRKPEIAGYVITELTDVHWECNGLLDMRRNPKTYHSELGNINADTVIIPEWERAAYWSGERVQLRVFVAHGAGDVLDGGEVHWRIHGQLWGSIELPTLAAGEVVEVVHLSFPAAQVEKPEMQRMLLEVFNRDGILIASNFQDLAIYPHLKPSQLISIYTPDQGLSSGLEALGYTIVPQINEAGLVITGKVSGQAYSCEMLSYLEQGGRMLVLADRVGEEGPVFPGILATSRQGTPWAGDWASSFSWLKRTGHYSQLPGGPMVDQSFDEIIPRFVLTGYKEWEFTRMVQAGIVVGWVHKPAVLIGERRFGKGRVILNSFHLPDDVLGRDPTATVLLDALIHTAGSR